MKKIGACILSLVSMAAITIAQTPGQSPSPQQEIGQEDVVRVTTELVQTDVVVMDKNEQVVSDLKPEDFELYENGKRQDLKFMEFVSVDAGRHTESSSSTAKVVSGLDINVPRELSAKDVRRVIAFVVDDVTIPSEDMVRARQMLSDFVENKMQEGDLVAIVRTVGGKGLLEQFTTDRQILRRAISQLGVRTIPPYLAFGGPEQGRITAPPSPFADSTTGQTVESSQDFQGPSEGTNQIPRGILALSVSNSIVDSLRQIPGRKSLVLLSGGLPLFDLTQSGAIVGDISLIFRRLTDNATRSGVVINTMDVRGLKASGAVARYVDTPAKSALGGGTFAGSDENTAGRPDTALLGERPLTE